MSSCLEPHLVENTEWDTLGIHQPQVVNTSQEPQISPQSTTTNQQTAPTLSIACQKYVNDELHIFFEGDGQENKTEHWVKLSDLPLTDPVHKLTDKVPYITTAQRISKQTLV